MRHFIHYHNSHKMGYSVSAMPMPKLFTSRGVKVLPGGIVWLIGGEGSKSPKTFYLGAVFKVEQIEEGTYEHPDFKNSARGKGKIFGESLLLSGNGWFETLKAEQNNFRNSLTEITGNPAAAHLQTLSGYGS